MRHRWVGHVAIAAAVWLSLVPLGAMLDGQRLLTAAVPLIVASAAVGSLLSLLRLPRGAIFVAQGVAVVGVLLWRGLTLAGPGTPLEALRSLTLDGVSAIRTGAAPLQITDGVAWLCLLLTAVLLLMVQLLADSLEQPGWSIVPLGLVFGIAALILLGDVPWLYALPVIAAYIIVLLVATPMGRDAAGGASRLLAFHASRAVTACVAGLTAAALALGVSAVVPLGNQQAWQEPGSSGPIQLADPTLQLDRDLRRPIDARVLTYTSDTGRPTYLRTVALTQLTSDGAQLVPMALSRFGLGSASPYPGEDVSVTVEMAVPSDYLPVPFAPRSISAAGTWAFDPETLSIVASGPERAQQSVGLTYTATARQPDPTRDEIAQASAGSGVPAVTTEIPDGLDDGVQQLLDSILATADDTDGAAALAIQDFLRSNRFEYSLSAPASTGLGTISNFLLTDRSGYCVHFAMGMAVLARMAGIPSRIAVGFAPGDETSPGTFEVTAHDAHAWPELYLEGLGWVPFEPTPAFSGPAGTSGTTGPQEEPSAEPTPEETQPEATPEPGQPTAEPTAPGVATGDEPSGRGNGAGVFAALAVLALLVAPGVARVVQRRRRLAHSLPAATAADGAWDEVRATYLDHGLDWPSGSPVPAAAVAAGRLAPEGAAALRSLAALVERSRFARDGESPPPAELVSTVLGAVAHAVPMRRRLLARFLPASMLMGRQG